MHGEFYRERAAKESANYVLLGKSCFGPSGDTCYRDLQLHQSRQCAGHRQLLDSNRITKWDWNTGTEAPLLTAEGCASNNGTKSTPCLCADILGDWREEVIWRTTDNKELRIYSTTILTDRRGYTLMHDPVYRLSVAWQNSAYNQPTHTGFYLGAETKGFPWPNIVLVEHK